VALITSDRGVLAVKNILGLGVMIEFKLGFPTFFFVASLTLGWFAKLWRFKAVEAMVIGMTGITVPL